ncbi:hypothetical protein PR202_ga23067 [Eleusine coracana subsp. coracana]|uniref:Retrotransposon gag domain-containing protein n=1 Tax=Eleusine coracana subsp. coracana TaxID=191504 RepID=A0AAV5D4Q7_ELECO|nr:hypothetical protein PR202_ga23067 [Eleusine coracana subsp. coracana]
MKRGLGTTDVMRRSVVIGGPTTDKKTDASHLQDTTAMTDVDVMIGTGTRIVMETIIVVTMMTLLIHVIIVAHLHPDRYRRSTTLSDEEFNDIKAYAPELRIARWPKGFKPVPIEKYDGQTNPREWLQLYSTVIQSVGGDTFVKANYLPVCLDPAIRIWLTSLPEKSVTSWGNLNRKLIKRFQATCNCPGHHFDLTRIKQKSNEPLHDYIKWFYAKKTEIPNVLDQQIIAAFQGGIRSYDLVREIGRRNHDLRLTAQECFEIADKFASGELALDDIRG